MNVLPAYVYSPFVCLVVLMSQKVLDPLECKLQTTVNRHVDAGTRIWVLSKSSQHLTTEPPLQFHPLIFLTSPNNFPTAFLPHPVSSETVTNRVVSALGFYKQEALSGKQVHKTKHRIVK